MKKITARMIRAKGSCYNPTDLDGVDSKTAWTLLEWLNYKHYKNGVDDAIWVFAYLADERTAREFAIWCAKRCKTDCKEIKEYLKVIEGYYLLGTHTKEELGVAHDLVHDSAHYSAYDSAERKAHDSAYFSACKAAYWAAGSAAGSAAYSAACNAAGSAAGSAGERKAQLAKIKRMLKAIEG